MDFVEICNVYVGKMIIKAAKRIFNSDKICRSYSDLKFSITFFGTQCTLFTVCFNSLSLNVFFKPNAINTVPMCTADETQLVQ